MFLHDHHKGKPFEHAGTPGFPYLELECLQLRHRKNLQDSRNAFGLLQSVKRIQKSLNTSALEDDNNETFRKDIDWRAKYLGVLKKDEGVEDLNFWDLVRSDLPSQLSEGFALGEDGPMSSHNNFERSLDPSVIHGHRDFEHVQLTRTILRAFHRADGSAVHLIAIAR